MGDKYVRKAMHVIACDQISNNINYGYKASMKRQVWQTNKAGAIDRLKLLDDDLGLLAQGNIRVEVRAGVKLCRYICHYRAL